MPKTTALLSTAQAAAVLGISPRRVQALIQAGRLPATRVGRSYVVRESDLAQVAERKMGRPRAAIGTRPKEVVGLPTNESSDRAITTLP